MSGRACAGSPSGPAVALAAGLGGWIVANQIAAEPTSDTLGGRSAC